MPHADKQALRERTWKLLEGRRVTRFPFPATGRIPNFVGAEQAAARAAALAEAGRDAASFKIGKRVYIAVDDDAHRARRRISESLHRFYPFFELDGLQAVAVYGPPDTCAQGLREVAQAGAEKILLNPVFDEAEQMERLMAEVVPKL